MRCRLIAGSLLTVVHLCALLPHAAHAGQDSRGLAVPKDVTFALELLSPLSTSTNQKGDKFDCKVLSPVEYAGAIVSGHVRKSKSSGKANKKSEMDLAFDTITLADGRNADFNAQVKEVNDVVAAGDGGQADPEGTVKSKSRVKVTIKKAAVGAAAGAIIGGILGGGKGAIMGAAIGAGIGASTTLATEGPDLEFKRGTQFTVLTNAARRREGAAEQPALRRAAAPATLPAPSSSYRNYKTPLYSLNVPDNWRESNTGGGVVFFPEGSYGVYDGKPGYTHAVMAGSVRIGNLTLPQATEKIVGNILKTASYLRQEGGYAAVAVAGREALAANFAGRWPSTGHVEMITTYTAMMQDGVLFYLITVSPQDDQSTYHPVFLNVIKSIQLGEQ